MFSCAVAVNGGQRCMKFGSQPQNEGNCTQEEKNIARLNAGMNLENEAAAEPCHVP
jgi:hypothetical protein